MTYPNFPQKCMFCDRQARWSLTYRAGKSFIPVCTSHEEDAREEIRSNGEGVSDKVRILATADQRRAWSATQKPPELTGWRKGLRVTEQRLRSLHEAPPKEATDNIPPTPSQRLGLRKKPEFLQKLGTEWSMLRARRMDSKRVEVLIDGDRYTIYTRA